MNSLLSPEIMEYHVELKENLELLRAQTVTLAKLRELVEEKGERRMHKWLQNVTDIEYVVDNLEYQFEELSDQEDFDGNSLNVRVLLKMKVLECLKEVEDLTKHYYSSSSEMLEITFEKPQRYSYDDLVRFTSDFDNKIGSGSLGYIYKGQLTDGVKVAVKVLRDDHVVEEASFISKVRILGNAYHQNLVKLYGYCSEGNTKAIVYEYMDNGSLDLILYKNPLGIEWDKFYAIAIEMAKALAYLHDGCRGSIIHYDFKAANVLLDSNLCPRLTDFSLADLMHRDQTHVTIMTFKGTLGYVAPEVFMPYSCITSKSDVYSYGMLLFEILGGKPNIYGNDWFPTTVWNKFQNNKLDEVIKSCGIMEKDRRKATILSMVAMWCIQFTPETRPSMSIVAAILEMEVFVNVPPNPLFTADPRIFKMLPDVNHSEVSSLTYSEFPSSTRSEVSSFSVDVPQNLDFVEEQESLQGGNASTDSIEILLHKLSLEKQNRYSYSELREFSSDFKNKIGSGSFGDVYRGHVSSNGMEVAIKVLKKKDFVEQMFVAEIKTVCDTNHENLVKLIGFCLEREKKALVYEYMEKGSLDEILYQKPLGIEWDKLYGIAIDIGKALVYLHHYCKPPIIHYDVKPANVLLDSDHSPKLTDFGLSSVKDREGTYVTMSKTKGTPGFGAPEVWQPFSPGSIKCDVYSFGMLLFEILGTAKNRQKTKWFPKHVWEKFKNGKLNDVIVERGFKEKDRKRAKILSVVALWCIQHTPQTRPTMITVVSVLEKEIAVNNPPNPFETSEFSVSMQPERGSSKKLRNKK